MMTVCSIKENFSFSGLSTFGGSSGNIYQYKPSRRQITRVYHNVKSAYPLVNQCHFYKFILQKYLHKRTKIYK